MAFVKFVIPTALCVALSGSIAATAQTVDADLSDRMAIALGFPREHVRVFSKAPGLAPLRGANVYIAVQDQLFIMNADTGAIVTTLGPLPKGFGAK